MKPGLNNITSLLNALGDPQEQIKNIHVAGTNGKGSTAAFLSAILSEAGYRVGLFTSPHLSRFTERIRINGTEIGENDVVRLVEKLTALAPESTTFFELATAMAWEYFFEQRVDLAIMETGMGGRFDATNAAVGIISVITPISLDHCEYLGETLAEIAFEKAGVIKQGRPVVLSEQSDAALKVIRRKCTESASHLHRSGIDFSGFWEESGFSYKGIRSNLHGLRPGIAGRYQAENAACALAAAELLRSMGVVLDDAALRNGIERASWPGRMEMIGEAPCILLDGAHNAAGGMALADALRDVTRNRLLMVAGVMGDKDSEGIFAPLLPLADRVFAVSPALERAFPSDRLAALCCANGVISEDAGTVAEGIERAKKCAGPGDLILVCGSLFVVGEARAYIRRENFEPFRG